MTEESNVEVVEKKKDEFVSQEHLATIIEAKGKALTAVQVANNAASEAKIAELEYKTMVQQVFIKYNLRLTDRIEDKDGRIIRLTEEDIKKEQQKMAQQRSATEPAPPPSAQPAQLAKPEAEKEELH